MNSWNRRFTGIMILLVALTIALPRAGSAEVLIDCPIVSNVGDNLSRGFYVPSYPGTSLDQVDLFFSSHTTGDYTIRLTARENTYDGPLIGVAEANVTITSTYPDLYPANFYFVAPWVDALSIVTFTLEQVAGPDILFYGIVTDEATCPIIQTSSTEPPLSVLRRHGINITIYGTGGVADEATSWSLIKTSYR